MKSSILWLSFAPLGSLYLVHELWESDLGCGPCISISKHLLVDFAYDIEIMLENLALLHNGFG